MMQNLVLAIGAMAFAVLPGMVPRAAEATTTTSSAEGDRVEGFRFKSIDGGQIGFSDWDGPVLVVNTASLCGFTPQLADIQALWDGYKDRGLTVLAVPSDSFKQELASDKEVSQFCTIQYGITLPMAAITPVTGSQAHPFYQWLASTAGFAPSWNFNKVLIGRDGAVLGTWGSGASPTGPEITAAIEAALAS